MDWDAERYHQLSQPQFAWGRRLIARLAASRGQRILDLGCGTGRLTVELLEAVGHGHVIALDRSSSMLREAARKSAEAPVRVPLHDAAAAPSRISFVQADGMALPFRDAFDAVFSAATFHWIPDHDALFASVYRTLAPGGRLVAQCGGGPNLARLLARARTLMSASEYADRFRSWREPWEFADVPTTIRRLERAGFTAVDVSLVPEPTTLPDRETYANFLSCVCVREHIALLPEEERPRFVDALAAQAAHDTPPFTLDYWRLNMSATRPTGAERAA